MSILLIGCFFLSFAAGYLGYKLSAQSIQVGIGFVCFLVIFSTVSLLSAQGIIRR